MGTGASLLVALAGAAVGCGGPMAGDASQDLGTQTSALQPAPGAPVPEWKDIWGLNDPAGGTASPTGDSDHLQ